MDFQKLIKNDTVSSLIGATKKQEVIIVEPDVYKKNVSVTYTIPVEAGYGLTQFTEYGVPILKKKSKLVNIFFLK